ncbi:hypothetical protein CHELA1G11_20881 [Hyphomicrobiales bacterium]|nr:hypothetical protein CHELA1G11_20881 [Hyphomicrobiales bacterium]CAH1692406.1 hypothetical protein CHELA1G2_21197 [Hyphomicrobiales bacterium]
MDQQASSNRSEVVYTSRRLGNDCSYPACAAVVTLAMKCNKFPCGDSSLAAQSELLNQHTARVRKHSIAGIWPSPGEIARFAELPPKNACMTRK